MIVVFIDCGWFGEFVWVFGYLCFGLCLWLVGLVWFGWFVLRLVLIVVGGFCWLWVVELLLGLGCCLCVFWWTRVVCFYCCVGCIRCCLCGYWWFCFLVDDLYWWVLFWFLLV